MGNGDAGETIGSRLYRDEQQLWKVKATPLPMTDVREGTCVGDGAGGEHGGKQQLFLPALQGPPFFTQHGGKLEWNPRYEGHKLSTGVFLSAPVGGLGVSRTLPDLV